MHASTAQRCSPTLSPAQANVLATWQSLQEPSSTRWTASPTSVVGRNACRRAPPSRHHREATTSAVACTSCPRVGVSAAPRRCRRHAEGRHGRCTQRVWPGGAERHVASGSRAVCSAAGCSWASGTLARQQSRLAAGSRARVTVASCEVARAYGTDATREKLGLAFLSWQKQPLNSLKQKKIDYKLINLRPFFMAF